MPIIFSILMEKKKRESISIVQSVIYLYKKTTKEMCYATRKEFLIIKSKQINLIEDFPLYACLSTITKWKFHPIGSKLTLSRRQMISN